MITELCRCRSCGIVARRSAGGVTIIFTTETFITMVMLVTMETFVTVETFALFSPVLSFGVYESRCFEGRKECYPQLHAPTRCLLPSYKYSHAIIVSQIVHAHLLTRSCNECC